MRHVKFLALIALLSILTPKLASAACVPASLQAALANPNPTSTANFGQSVGASGNFVIVGVPGDDPEGISAAGSAVIFDAGTGTALRTLHRPQLGANLYFGWSVAIEGNLAVVGCPFDSPDRGTVYVFNASTGALVATLHNPSPETDDQFGYSVAISGTHVVVGAVFDNPGGLDNAGSAYVFDALTGTLLSTLNNPNPAANDYFGISVSISGDRAVVGASNDNPGGIGDAGSAYVFDTTNGNLVTTLVNPDPTGADWFGLAVGIAGNIAVVGAVQDDPGGLDSAGAAYLFDATTGALTATLARPNAAANDFFGYTVAISGTVVLVGAPGAAPGGSVEAFDAATGAFLSSTVNPFPAGGDNFGFGVAISDNLAVVGAYLDDPAGLADAGTAYLYRCTDCPPSDPGATLDNPARTADSRFGGVVAVSGILAVVGAPNADPGGVMDAGAAYVYNTETGALLAQLNNPNPSSGDNFGNAVGISGHLVIVGAHNEDPPTTTNGGAAYLFDALTGTLLRTIANPAPGNGDDFGSSVAISGQLIVVGADGDLGPVNSDGMAYSFDALTGSLVATLTNPIPGLALYFGKAIALDGELAVVGGYRTAHVFNAVTGALVSTLEDPVAGTGFNGFGNTVAISGDLAVVGSSGYSLSGTSQAGKAYVYNALNGSMVKDIYNPFPAVSDTFGTSVAISGTYALIGAATDNPDGTAIAGSAFVINAITGDVLATVLNPEPGNYDEFGAAVAISGDTAVVGAYSDDGGSVSDSGTAYAFSCLPATPTPTVTPTETPTETATETPTETATETATETPTDTPSPTATDTPSPTATPDRREFGDFDNSGCTDLQDFLFLLDYWSTDVNGSEMGIPDFLALLDYWQTGPSC